MRRGQKINEIEINKALISFSRLRVVFLLGIIGVFLAGSMFMALKNRVLIDEVIILIVLDIIVCLSLFVSLARKRISDKGIYKGTSYARLLIIIVFAWVLTIVFNLLPVFFAPMGVIALILVSGLPASIAMGICMYFNTVLSLIGGMGTYSFYCYGIIIVVTVWLGDYLKDCDKKNKILIMPLLFAEAFFIPIVFRYCSLYELKLDTIIFSGICAAITVAFALILYPLLLKFSNIEFVVKYEDILDDNYPLISDMRDMLPLEYVHARRVSYSAGMCAGNIGANAIVAQAGGLYYNAFNIQQNASMGKMLKEMNDRCFPVDVISIMVEHGGNERKPQTKESAIVHMTNEIVTKVEAIKAETMQTDWNLNMLVYQTLNELSQSGIYDESGIGMNEFLKIRDTLIKEAASI